mgnify:CR=1 FL=1
MIFITLSSYSIFAQDIKFQGIVKDTLRENVPFVSVVASSSKTQNDILAFTNGDENGNYTLKIPPQNSQDSIWITFRHLSHVTKVISVKLESATLNVSLVPKPNKLDEVLVKTKKTLTVKGDIITYKVEGLKKAKDYTIEEVIDRIPGVSIGENGQIKYQNKPISHLYINGVDLLEGRYNIATRGIPANAVKDIEILKRHNHARIDKGVTESDDVAFNLKIKDNTSLIFGSAKGDVGLPLLTAKAEVTPIYIKDKLQDIASLKANNIGESLSSNGANLVNGNIDFSSIKLEDLNLLRAPNTSGFGLTQKFWLDNESVAITNDVLIKSKKEALFKVAVNYNSNNNQIERASNSIYFFGSDSTTVASKAQDNLDTKTYYSGLVYEVNKEELFLKNKLSINGETSDGISSIVQNTLPINYQYNDQKFSIDNALEVKTKIADNILNSGLLFQYVSSQENTGTLPSVFQENIPSTFEALQTQQDINVRQLNLAAYSNYTFDFGKAKWLFSQRLHFKSENLETDLEQRGETETTNLTFPFRSDFALHTFKSLTALSADYEWKRLKVTLKPELVFIDLNQEESLNSNLNRKSDYLFFQPKVNLAYRFNQSWTMGTDFAQDTNISRFSELFNGIILNNFSSLSRNPNQVNITKTLSSSTYFGYRNILKGFFFNNTTNVERRTSDFTFTTTINDDGLLAVDAIERPNRLTSFSNTTNLTKRFFQILSTELSYTYSARRAEQFFNEVLQNNRNTFHRTMLELDLDNNTWYGIKYIGNLNYGISKVDAFTTTNTFLKHAVELDFYTTEKSRINLSFESVYSSFSESDDTNTNTLFSASFYYKPHKKLFLRASLINIFNEDVFNSIFSSSNFITQSQFSLRPRQFTIGLNYSL